MTPSHHFAYITVKFRQKVERHETDTMTSFKLYLPSNACPSVYPNNSPTDFRTVFDKPIELDGKWEVGLESICYSSNILDVTEHADMTLHVGKTLRPLLNNQHEYRYQINADETWSGFTGVQPTTFESNPQKLDNVLNTLNSLNDVILTSGNAFNFRRNAVGDVFFEPYDEDLFLCLSPRLTKLLGFQPMTILGQYSKNAGERPPDSEPLKREDYHVRYLHIHLQKDTMLTIKDVGPPFDEKKETVIKYKNVSYTVTTELKKNRLTVSNPNKDLVLEFSPHIQRAFQLPRFIFGEHSSHSTFDVANIVTRDQWYVNIYRTEMRRTRLYEYTTIPLTIMPWKSNTSRRLLHAIGRKVQRTLKRKLKRSYHKQRHHFSLSLQPSQHVTLKLGKRLEVEFGDVLTHLLGLPKERLKRSQTNALREVDALFNRSRRLHLVTNIVQPTAVGNKQVKILRDFVHVGTNNLMSAKHFDTISYVPVITNRIDNIHVQLVNDRIESVKIKDTKTLVTLYFRKI